MNPVEADGVSPDASDTSSVEMGQHVLSGNGRQIKSSVSTEYMASVDMPSVDTDNVSPAFLTK